MRGQDIIDRINKARSNVTLIRERVSKVTDLKLKKEHEDVLDNLDSLMDKFEEDILSIRAKEMEHTSE